MPEGFTPVRYIAHCTKRNKNGNTHTGFAVHNHPNGNDIMFSKSSLSMKEKYDKAVSYKEYLDNYVGYFDPKRLRLKYLYDRGNAIQVFKTGFKQRHFANANKIQRRLDAMKYLLSISSDEEKIIILLHHNPYDEHENLPDFVFRWTETGYNVLKPSLPEKLFDSKSQSENRFDAHVYSISDLDLSDIRDVLDFIDSIQI